jgi:predicted RNA polymerase sigma factor
MPEMNEHYRWIDFNNRAIYSRITVILMRKFRDMKTAETSFVFSSATQDPFKRLHEKYPWNLDYPSVKKKSNS